MRFVRLALSVIVSASFVSASAVAGQRGAHATPSAHTPATVHAAKPTLPTPIPIAQRIAGNPALAARLQPLLPSGTTLAAAADGFKNEGQFIAALHVSRNLNIPFAQLKAEMTGSDRDSLGQAIHDLQPTANAKAAAKTAHHQARADLKAAHGSTTDADDKKHDR